MDFAVQAWSRNPACGSRAGDSNDDHQMEIAVEIINPDEPNPLLFRGGLLPVLFDAEPSDLRLQGLARYSEFCSGP